jgi:hypothetical protein
MGLSAASLPGQEPGAPSSVPVVPASDLTAVVAQPNDPTLTLRNQKTLESFEPAADEEYRLSRG